MTREAGDIAVTGMKYVATFVFSAGEVCVALVQKNTKKLPHLNGKWNGIGGKMEIGESPVGAAIRELREETGLIAEKDNMVFVEHQRFNILMPGYHEIYWYAINNIPRPARLPKVNDAGERLAWVPLTHGIPDLGFTDGGLCPNLDYLVPKAIVFLRTPYLDRPA